MDTWLSSNPKRWIWQEEGQDLIEYALIILLIALVVIAGLTGVGGQLAILYVFIADSIPI